MAYTVHQAKTHFSRLLKEAETGKEVIVMRGSKPVARVVAINQPAPEPEVPFRLIGAYRGKMRWDDDAFDPMTDDELRECGLGYLADAPLATPASEPGEQ